ncbi:hypothetical protein Desaci_4328 [Desulfosporosinus acidiphilus SJ4]|uniref:Uncharacterized protein n=1 Tax=Desulfosporosinus acidiphilus (strain DSM 22704 / JCM 16185 / SJ4) TaxID=646529 RepID=I4DBK4_DESAJ|nr:TIGR04086 family membrane protein [Desulfosporosinus acidiphilus]AFM43178.1 hypothetical protein Desaci_4328 [Desulfosporosinus acidiphilus SJ4]
MLSFVLRGITTALLVTLLTLLAGIVWGAMGLGGLSVSNLVDIGLLASCLIGGYRASRESGELLLGGVTGVGYVTVGTLLLALFLPIRVWGFIQVLGEGAILGTIAGAFGAGGSRRGNVRSAWAGRRTKGDQWSNYNEYGREEQTGRDFEWDTKDFDSSKETLPAGDDIDDDYWKTDSDKGACDSDLGIESRLDFGKDFEKDYETHYETHPGANSGPYSGANLKSDIAGHLSSDFGANSEIDWPWNRKRESAKPRKTEPLKLEPSQGMKEDKPWWE